MIPASKILASAVYSPEGRKNVIRITVVEESDVTMWLRKTKGCGESVRAGEAFASTHFKNVVKNEPP